MDWVPRSVRAKAAYRASDGLVRERRGPRPPRRSSPSASSLARRPARHAGPDRPRRHPRSRRDGQRRRRVDGISVGDTVADDRLGPGAVRGQRDPPDLSASILALPERERTVLGLYYYETMTLAEIGTILGVSESRVCQIHGKAVLQLRSRLLAATRDSDAPPRSGAQLRQLPPSPHVQGVLP